MFKLDDDEQQGILYNFFTIVASILSGFSLGIIGVAYCLYRPLNRLLDEEEDDDEDDDEDEDEDEDAYNRKFFDEYEELPSRELSFTELYRLRLKVVEQETPFGKIIMTYNSDTESFWYYVDADKNTLPYKTLDTVARYFAITYDCKNICVNYKEEWEKGKEKMLAQKEFDEKQMMGIVETEEAAEGEKKVYPKEKNVFAHFKSYNTKGGGSGGGGSGGNMNKNNENKDENKSKNGNEKKKYIIMTEKANMFKYKGRTEEYLKLVKEVNEAKAKLLDSPRPIIDYAAFKNLYNDINEANDSKKKNV